MDSNKLSTEKSLYEPIKIEVNGKLYLINKVTPKLLKKVAEHERQALRGDPDAIVQQFSVLTGVEAAIVEELDIRDLTAALMRITKEIMRPDETIGKAEKNASKPEAKPSPQ